MMMYRMIRYGSRIDRLLEDADMHATELAFHAKALKALNELRDRWYFDLSKSTYTIARLESIFEDHATMGKFHAKMSQRYLNMVKELMGS